MKVFGPVAESGLRGTLYRFVTTILFIVVLVLVQQSLGWIAALAFLWLSLLLAASVIAAYKARSSARWFFLTLLFGPIAFLVLLFLPVLALRKRS